MSWRWWGRSWTPPSSPRPPPAPPPSSTGPTPASSPPASTSSPPTSAALPASTPSPSRSPLSSPPFLSIRFHLGQAPPRGVRPLHRLLRGGGPAGVADAELAHVLPARAPQRPHPHPRRRRPRPHLRRRSRVRTPTTAHCLYHHSGSQHCSYKVCTQTVLFLLYPCHVLTLLQIILLGKLLLVPVSQLRGPKTRNSSDPK